MWTFFGAILLLLLLLSQASEQLQKRRSCSCNFYFETSEAIFVQDENADYFVANLLRRKRRRLRIRRGAVF